MQLVNTKPWRDEEGEEREDAVTCNIDPSEVLFTVI